MKRAVLSGLLLTAALSAAPALAQTSAPTARALELSRRYVAAANLENMMEMNAAVVAQQLSRVGNASADSQVINTAMTESMRALQPMVIARTTAVFAAKFTEPELEGLVTFYESPIGRSITIKTAQLGPEMGALMAELVPALNQDMARRVCAKQPGTELCEMIQRVGAPQAR